VGESKRDGAEGGRKRIKRRTEGERMVRKSKIKILKEVGEIEEEITSKI